MDYPCPKDCHCFANRSDKASDPVYWDGGWIREGHLAICPECKAVKEGTISWHLEHESKCAWKPAGTWFSKRLASELEAARRSETAPLAVAVADHCAACVADIGDCLACTLQNEMGKHEDFCPVGRYMAASNRERAKTDGGHEVRAPEGPGATSEGSVGRDHRPGSRDAGGDPGRADRGDAGRDEGAVAEPNASDPGARIAELETALRSCLQTCGDCGTFATWSADAPSAYAYRPIFCDPCKVRREPVMGEGRLAGKLVFSNWTRLTRNIELTRIYAGSVADDACPGFRGVFTCEHCNRPRDAHRTGHAGRGT